jgi:hypothetical protein
LFDILHTDISLVLSFVVLVLMGCVALAFSLMLSQKFRALRRLPRNLSVRVFNKTYNVFEPNADHQKIINSHTGLIIFIAIYGSWIAVTFAVFEAFAFGGILACIAFLVCASLLMIDESQEFNRNAGVFARAVENGADLGQGDVEVLNVMMTTLPRLSMYHLVLAVVFFASAATVPLIVETVFVASGGIAFGVVALGSTMKAIPMLSILIIAGLFATALVLVKLGLDRAREKIFGFPPSIPVDILGRQFFRMRMYVGVLHHHPALREPSPEETEKANKREIEQHSES